MSKRISLWRWLISLVSLFVILGLSEYWGLTNLLTHNPPYNLPEFAQIIGAVGSLILTGGLVYLYNRQTQILDEERKQTEFQSQALLRIEDFKVISPIRVSSFLDDREFGYDQHLRHADLIEIEISNIGQAPADELRIGAMLHGDEHGWEAQGPLVKGDWETAVERMLGNAMDPIRLNDRGELIGSDERNITYTASIHTTEEDLIDQWDVDSGEIDFGVSKYCSATEVLWMLQDLDESDVTAGMRLWYRDGTGNREPINIQFAVAESQTVADFRTATMKGRPMMPDEIPPPELWWA